MLGLLVDELQAAAVPPRAESLRGIAPGLAGYFARWWQRQQKRQERAALQDSASWLIFDLLSVALGPLGRADLMELARPDVQRGAALDEALGALGRFVIGDGVQRGLVFSHPLLRDYFLERLAPSDLERLEGRFLAYGSHTLAALASGGSRPEVASTYVVAHYGAHLRRARAAPELQMELLCPAWQAACEAGPGMQGFLADVGGAWQAVASANEEDARAGQPVRWLADEVRCALCLASARSLANQVTAELLAALVREGLWGPARALGCVRQKTPEFRNQAPERALALSALAPLLPEALLPEALELALDIWHHASIELNVNQVRLLRPLLDRLSGLPDQVIAGAEALRPGMRAPVLAEIAVRLPEPRRSRLARVALDAAWAAEPWDRNIALGELTNVFQGAELRLPIRFERLSDYACSLLGLLPVLDQEGRREVLVAAISTEGGRQALASSAPSWFPHASLLPPPALAQWLVGCIARKAAAITREPEPGEIMASVSLGPLFPLLSEEQRGQVRDLVRDVPRDRLPSDLLLFLPLAERIEYLRWGLELFSSDDYDPIGLSFILIPAIRSLEDEQLAEALRLVLSTKSMRVQTHGLLFLAARAQNTERSWFLSAARQSAAAIPDPKVRASTLLDMACPEGLAREPEWAAASSGIEPEVRAAIFMEALSAPPGSHTIYRVLDALRKLVAAVSLPAAFSEQALRWVRQHLGFSSETVGLLGHLEASDRRAALLEILAEAQVVRDGEGRLKTVAALARSGKMAEEIIREFDRCIPLDEQASVIRKVINEAAADVAAPLISRARKLLRTELGVDKLAVLLQLPGLLEDERHELANRCLVYLQEHGSGAELWEVIADLPPLIEVLTPEQVGKGVEVLAASGKWEEAAHLAGMQAEVRRRLAKACLEAPEGGRADLCVRVRLTACLEGEEHDRALDELLDEVERTEHAVYGVRNDLASQISQRHLPRLMALAARTVNELDLLHSIAGSLDPELRAPIIERMLILARQRGGTVWQETLSSLLHLGQVSADLRDQALEATLRVIERDHGAMFRDPGLASEFGIGRGNAQIVAALDPPAPILLCWRIVHKFLRQNADARLWLLAAVRGMAPLLRQLDPAPQEEQLAQAVLDAGRRWP